MLCDAAIFLERFPCRVCLASSLNVVQKQNTDDLVPIDIEIVEFSSLRFIKEFDNS